MEKEELPAKEYYCQPSTRVCWSPWPEKNAFATHKCVGKHARTHGISNKRKKGRPKPQSHTRRMPTPFTPKENNTNDFDRLGQECQPRSHLKKAIPMLFTDWERNDNPRSPKENNTNTMHRVEKECQTHLYIRRAIPPVFTHQDFDSQRKLGENWKAN